MVENRSRNANLEIRNFPEIKNENVDFIVANIGKAIGITNIQEGDIQVAHRVNAKKKDNNGSRSIIVNLRSRYIRNVWLQKYREFQKKGEGALTAKKIHGNLPDLQVFIHEHLTVSKKMLLNKIRAFAREKEFRFVWVKDAMILIKKN